MKPLQNFNRMQISKLISNLEDIKQCIEAKEFQISALAKTVVPKYRLSVYNLYRYIILRTFDLRKYHDKLSELGVSSIRTSQGYIYSNLCTVLKNLRLLNGEEVRIEQEIKLDQSTLIGFERSKKLLKKNTNRLFKRKQKKHFAEIMVTLPTTAARDKGIIQEMADNGMAIARINLSHDTKAEWLNMVNFIKDINNKTHHNIKIYMDLSGPKFRTSQIELKDKKGKLKDKIIIKEGDHIVLTKRKTKGKSSVFTKKGNQIERAEIGVMLDEIIDAIAVDDVVMFDDGMIKAVATAKDQTDVDLKITAAYKNKLSSHKGINLPNSRYDMPALTEADIDNLEFVCQHADIVGYSFVKSENDVAILYNHLKPYNTENLGVVFKIETQEAFENLPSILVEGMKHHSIGVMIARGDLAVELGFERISEVQNQILWLCEAAHVPVIWATQVLENLAKTGIPTRAEISDAIMGAHAECIMLNKGPFINNAIRTLENILVRMESHGFKQKNALRPLNIAKQSLNVLD